jgi:hypothetical protein
MKSGDRLKSGSCFSSSLSSIACRKLPLRPSAGPSERDELPSDLAGEPDGRDELDELEELDELDELVELDELEELDELSEPDGFPSDLTKGSD